MDETTVIYKVEKCPNCGRKVIIQRNAIKCRECGFIFTKYIKIKNEEEINERNTTRRTGDGVDQIDG